MFQLKSPLIKPMMAMRRTATCEVTVLDEKNQLIPNTTVSFCPNQVFYHSGSNTVGEGDDRLTQIHQELAAGKQIQSDPVNQRATAYSATTDKQGVAVIRNLPAPTEAKAAFGNMFFVHCEGWNSS